MQNLRLTLTTDSEALDVTDLEVSDDVVAITFRATTSYEEVEEDDGILLIRKPTQAPLEVRHAAAMAAPAMLEVLKELLEWDSQQGYFDNRWWKEARRIVDQVRDAEEALADGGAK